MPGLNGNAILRATVRIFALAPGRGPPAVEIGRAMTDESGKCESFSPSRPAKR